MEETMNKEELVVETEASEVEEVTQEITIVEEESSSGPSKGFVALVAGILTAAAIGVAVGVNRHKKKKASLKEFEEDLEEDELVTDEDEDVNTEIPKSKEKSEEK